MTAQRPPREADHDDAGEPAASGGRRLRILYIAGAQHCGSTLLDAVLGNAPESFSLGEVGGFQRYERGQECDCRRPAASCAPCQAVLTGLASVPGLARFHRVTPGPLRERRIHWSFMGTRARAAYARVADDLFDAAAAHTGSTVLVDSSKNIGRAAALVHDSRHDVRVVHLVRDGRGYVRSRRLRAARIRLQHKLPLAIVPWLAKNLTLWAVVRRRAPAGRYLLCRYEVLVANPEDELARIGRFADMDTSGLAEAATGEGLPRGQLYEPRRRVDYRVVRLDPGRLSSPPLPGAQNSIFWACGGFLSSRWGYTRHEGGGDPSSP